MQNQLDTIRKRFEREAHDFDAIYRQDRGLFHSWFNRTFRKPIFERHDIAFKVMGNLNGKTLLDVGCGSGLYCVDFVHEGGRYALGIDFSSQMIELASRRARENGVEDRCRFQKTNFLETDLQEQYSFSIAMGVFDYLSDPAMFLRRMRSVTVDRIIVSLPGHSMVREPLRKLRYKIGAKGQVYFYNKPDIRQIVTAAGISHYEIVPITTGSGFILNAEP